MRPSPRNPWLFLAMAGGLAYPLVVYAGLARLPPSTIVLFALGLIGLRLAGMRRLAQSPAWTVSLGLAGLGLAGLLALSPALAVKAYPVAMSLAVATVFALSIRFPPTVIERFARLAEPDLPAQGVAYTRKVTQVWIAFLLGNAGISAATALWGSLEQWTLWNGLLSYLAMGLLFAGEVLVRGMVRKRSA